MATEKKCYSGIGGQAVMEGVMMKNKDNYAVAVRMSNGEIDIKTHDFTSKWANSKLREIPFIRGTFNFIDSMFLGTEALNASMEYFDEDEEQGENKSESDQKKTSEVKSEAELEKQKKMDKLFGYGTTALALLLAVFLFMFLPSFLSGLINKVLKNDALLSVLEGVIRILIFILYVLAISLLGDIKRLFMYHGAEHKCINCIEHGNTLTVENVRNSSRLHKRCGTSFIFFVFIVSIVVSFFIKVTNPLLRVGCKLLLLPLTAGISYELIRLAGKSENLIVKILSAPGMGVQLLTTKEPDDSMIEVAIASVEAVFDWKAFLKEKFPENDQ